MEPKKVLFFIYQMGAGGAARTLLNIMNNLDREKFTPILVTLNYDGSYESYLKNDVKFIKLGTKRLRSAIFPLAKVIRNEKVDLVFSTIPNYNTIAILAKILSFTNAKIIVREAAYLGGTFKSNIKLVGYGVLYKLADKVIALSKGVKENIVNRYKVKPEHIKVIYNPVDINQIQKSIDQGNIPLEYEAIFQDDAKVIVTAGRLVKDKDHQTLLHAFAKVNKEVKSKLVILGEGALEQELKEQVKKLQLEKNVFFIGFQQNPYIYFDKADVFVLSSIREGFGHVLAEALASGTPIVSTDCKPGAVEVLEFGKYGFLCEIGNPNDMADKIKEMLSQSDEQRNEIIDNGKKRANEFHASEIVKQYEDTFSEIIGTKQNRRRQA